ncbi:MAG: hypothetical protein HYZ29_22140 [Myxococcales bacterium]|nr:hypothetical protein [Myxococcales bacterium]
MDELDLVLLDRQISRAVVDWVRWQRRLRRGAALDHDPFVAHPFITRLGFERVRDRPEHDPLRGPMLRWLYRLVDDKANLPWLVALARARAVDTHPLEQPARVSLSLNQILARVLSDRARSERWAVEWLRRAAPAAEAERRVWDRRREVAEHLRVDPDALELPAGGMSELARAWLDLTEDRAGEFRAPELHLHLASTLGLEAHAGWPTRANAETLGGLFRQTRLLDGLPLDPGPLPAALAPASFLRALARLGAAFADALAPPDQPFVIAHDPYGLRRLAHGALFAWLALTPVFLRRELGVSAGQARDHQRVLARVVFHEGRARAVRVLLRRAALDGDRKYRDAFEELTARLLGRPLPPDLAGAIFAPRRDDAQRFVSMLLAARHARELTEDHDEDWYRNPRAVEQLRYEAALPPVTTVPTSALDAASTELERALESMLG